MKRPHGRIKRGQRLHARVPHGRWTTMTVLAGLRSGRIDAPCVFDGPIKGESVLADVQQVLVPTLSPGNIAVTDDLSSHQGVEVCRAIRAKLFFLPPCNPDLDPIEPMFAKLKTLLRRGWMLLPEW